MPVGELELACLQALAAVLCCGPVYDQKLLNDDGAIYYWLDILLGDHDDKVMKWLQCRAMIYGYHIKLITLNQIAHMCDMPSIITLILSILSHVSSTVYIRITNYSD